jgi:uncharacterized protein (TIGR03437 family)
LDADTPSVSAVSAATGTLGDTLTITGTGFGTVLNNVQVTIGGANATLTSVNDTTIVLTVPATAQGSHKIVVTRHDKGHASMNGHDDFTCNIKVTELKHKDEAGTHDCSGVKQGSMVGA